MPRNLALAACPLLKLAPRPSAVTSAGQVMDPERATEQAKAREKPGRILVAFGGDCSFNWLLPRDLRPFDQNYERLRGQAVPKVGCHGSLTRRPSRALWHACKLRCSGGGLAFLPGLAWGPLSYCSPQLLLPL